jgi:hypothetical protein
MTLAMVDPLDDVTASRISADNQSAVCRAVCLASEFARAFDRHFPSFKKPEKSFGPADAARAVKAARVSIAESPMRQARRAGEALPGWLSEKAAAGAQGAAGAKPGASPDEIAMPDWLDEEPERPVRPAQQAPAAKALAPPRTPLAPRPPLGKTPPPGGVKGGKHP